MILLDTHALVWMDTDASDLGRTTRHLIKQAWKEQQLGVSAVTFWECAMLHARGRIRLPESPAAWRADWLKAGLMEWPVDGAIAILAVELASLHKDPADRFIVATAIVHRATLVTADERLLEWQHSVRRHHAGR